MYAKVFRSMWDGTLAEHWEGWVVLVFLMAHADPEGLVDMTPGAVARRSGLPLDVVQRGLEALEAPDPMSRSPKEGGRRLVRLDPARSWGWRIVNYCEYRGLIDAESVREQTRERVRRHRERNGESSAGQREVTLGNAPLRDEEAEAEAEGRTQEESNSSSAEVARNEALALGVEPQPAAVARASKRAARRAFEEDAEQHALVRLPTNRVGTEYPVGPLMVAELVRLYPGVNVEAELLRMRGWLLARPKRRKTWGGMPAFVTNWLSGEQDSGRAPARGGGRSGSDARWLEANAGALRGDGTDG